MLGGLIGLRDATPPPGAAGGPPAGSGGRRKHGALRLKVRRLKGGRLRLHVVGKGVRQVRRVDVPGARTSGCAWIASGRSARPSRASGCRRSGRTKVVARIVRKDGTRAKRVKRVRRR